MVWDENENIIVFSWRYVTDSKSTSQASKSAKARLPIQSSFESPNWALLQAANIHPCTTNGFTRCSGGSCTVSVPPLRLQLLGNIPREVHDLPKRVLRHIRSYGILTNIPVLCSPLLLLVPIASPIRCMYRAPYIYLHMLPWIASSHAGGHSHRQALHGRMICLLLVSTSAFHLFDGWSIPRTIHHHPAVVSYSVIPKYVQFMHRSHYSIHH